MLWLVAVVGVLVAIVALAVVVVARIVIVIAVLVCWSCGSNCCGWCTNKAVVVVAGGATIIANSHQQKQ